MPTNDDIKIALQDMGAIIKEKRGSMFPKMTRSEFAKGVAGIDIDVAKDIEYGKGDVAIADFVAYTQALGMNDPLSGSL